MSLRYKYAAVKILSVIALLLTALTSAIAQMPDYSKVYLLKDDYIYAFDPSQPGSLSLSTITVPIGGYTVALAICPPLNGSSTMPTFYITSATGSRFEYFYYNGSSWTATGHAARSVNIGAGGGYIFDIAQSFSNLNDAEVYRYDGVGEVLVATFPADNIIYDIVADCEGNFYVLNPKHQTGFLRKYSSSGTLLQSWTINNPTGFTSSSGIGMIGNTIYYEEQAGLRLRHGTIGATTVTFDAAYVQLPANLSIASDMATGPTVFAVAPRPVSIAAGANNVCAGTPVTFMANTGSNTGTPAYRWMVNGANAGTNSNTFSYVPSNGDVVHCEIIFTGLCINSTPVSSNAVTMAVNSPIAGTVTIRNIRDGFCTGSLAEILATPVNGGTPAYQWYRNGLPVGANAALYTDNMLLPGDRIYVVMTPAGPCTLPTPALSDTIKVETGTPVVPGINLNTIPPSILCAGTPVTFITNDIGGGNNPQYKWYKNGALMNGVATNTYTDAGLNNSDTIMVVLVSSAACPLTRETPSNKLGVNVYPQLMPQVSAIANPGTAVAPGQYVTFAATATNGGAAPWYQWHRNGIEVPGQTGSTWTTNNLRTGDEINVRMESKAPCPSAVFVTSNVLRMQVAPTGIGSVAQADERMSLFPNPNAGSFIIRLAGSPSFSGAPLTLEIFNAIGQRVWQEASAVPGADGTIQVTIGKALADGYYTLKLHTQAGSEIRPFILRR